MKHETIRELLALQLYGETDAEEERALAQHLAECSECARFARELERGLGRARATQAPAELPADWDARLADATAALHRASWMRSALLVGSGLAAGVLVMLAWGRASRAPVPAPVVVRAEPEAPAFLRFQGDKPPPPATGGGPATRYLAWQAR